MTETHFRTVEVWQNDNRCLQSGDWLIAVGRQLHFNEAISSLPWQIGVVNGHKAFPDQWTALKGISHHKYYQRLQMADISSYFLAPQ